MLELSINPLNVLDKRNLDYIPAHFETIQIEGISPILLTNWIYKNTKGRFSIAKKTKIVHNKTINKTVIVTTLLGFEDPKEMILTILKCPLIKERK
jgi:hypothetical protein